MNRYTLIMVIVCLPIAYADGQAKTRKLPGIINHPSFNLYAPFISFDGNALLFVSNDGEDGALTVFYSSRETDWVQPVVLPKHVNHRLVYMRGFALSADGKKMYYTGSKTPVVGGYDIMTSDLKGSTWTEPQNFMPPINSKANEACPSFSPDGSEIYFMRCDKMDQARASGCKLFSSKKKPNGQWEEPKELPASINTGNSQTPRIMADGETLIFSSDKMGGSKGGMDLYVAKRKGSDWSTPLAMDWINTAGDDQFVSVAALGRYLLKDAPGTRKNNELVEYLIPDDMRPRGVMKVEGVIKDPNNNAVPSYISVIDLADNKRVFSGRPNAEGNYLLYLMEGARYEMSIDPEQSNIGFYGRQFDLTTEKIPQRERVNVVLKPPAINDELPLDLITFKSGTAVLDPTSELEIKRLMRLAKANPLMLFEIQVNMNGFIEDSLQSNPDLTELRMDTLRLQVAQMDSTGQLVKHDSLVVKQVYHNDRTSKQAQAILEYIVNHGGDPKGFAYKTAASPAALPEERRLIVKAVTRQK